MHEDYTEVLGVLETNDPDEKIEVLKSREADGSEVIKLQLVVWGKGLGWHPQKTITLATSEVEHLCKILQENKNLLRLRPQRWARTEGSNVIELYCRQS